MAETKRGNILENIRSLIVGLARVKKAEINSTRAHHVSDPDTMPFVNITSSGDYDPARTGIGASREMWTLTVNINILTMDGNAEEVRGDVKEILSADITRGGNAKNTKYLNDNNRIDVDIPADASAVQMNYEIDYTTEEGKKT